VKRGGGDMKGTNVQANRAREHFITRDVAQRVIDACPDAEWRLIFALSRFGGLRCPSEHLSLKWSDIDWAAGRFSVRSPKLEHHEDKGERLVPIFPELRSYLEEAFDPEAIFVISRHRNANANLRTQLLRIIQKAEVSPWPKLFHNLRASRATELVAAYPAHVAAASLGHSALVAQKHYWQVTEADFERASTTPEDEVSGRALHKPVQSEAVLRGADQSQGQEARGIAANSKSIRLGTVEKAPPVGLEPTTKRLTAACSTN
jgi:integrase